MNKSCYFQPGARTVFHGGELEGAIWYTDDRDHAAYFGDVVETDIVVENPRCLIAMDVVGHASGYEADEMLYEVAKEAADCGHDWLVVSGWEGRGLCYLDLSDF